jgi:hypothetical protein
MRVNLCAAYGEENAAVQAAAAARPAVDVAALKAGLYTLHSVCP